MTYTLEEANVLGGIIVRQQAQIRPNRSPMAAVTAETVERHGHASEGDLLVNFVVGLLGSECSRLLYVGCAVLQSLLRPTDLHNLGSRPGMHHRRGNSRSIAGFYAISERRLESCRQYL